MNAISAVSSKAKAATASDPTSTGTTVSNPSQALGQDDFLKLLAVQFQSQDPTKPMDDTAFISQMAQFTSLQQTQTLTQQMTQMRADQDLATAASYIGKQVTVQNTDGTTTTGTVTAVDNSGSAPQIVMNSKNYDLSKVIKIEPVATSSTTPTSTSASATSA